jgi:hypothetical protein
LRSDVLTLRIELQTRHQRFVFGHVSRVTTAANDDGVSLGSELQRLLGPNYNAVHGRHYLSWTGDLGPPTGQSDAIDDMRRDQGIDLVKPVKCDNCYSHARASQIVRCSAS